YTIDWTGPGGFSSTDQDLTGLQAGTYSVTVTDDNGCVQTLDIEVGQPDELTLSSVITDPDCADDSNGSIDITVQGGTLNYSFVWNGPLGFIGNLEDLSNLPGGTYNVTVTDANGCTVSDSFVLTQPDEILITLDISDPNCGLADGEVVANVTGGISASGYQYGWFDSGNTLIGSNDTITGLVAGSYFLTVTDDNGCNAFQFFTLSDANGSVTAAITNVICQTDANGAINITVSDLTPPLNFSWIGPGGFTSSSEDISMLIAGDYTVTIVDDVGCTLVNSFIVGAPQAIFINSNVNNVSCPGDANGSIDLSVQGGVGTLSYAWTGPSGFTASSQDLTGLAPGLYTVTVTDANLCQVMEDYVVGNGANYSLTADITDIICAGDGNGAIDLIVTPAISNGTYAWTGPNGFSSTMQDINGLEPGTYSVTLTTPSLCSFNADFIIDSATEIEVISTVTSSSCGLSIGAVSLSVTGGTVAVDYIYSIFSLPSLNVISTSNSASGLDGGLYGYTVSDDSGCAVTGAFTVSDGVGALTAVISDETCEDAMDGAIDITASGLVGSLSFLWSGPNGYSSASQDLTGLAAGVYTVSVTDANGCVIGDSYEVLPTEGILVTATITDVSCFGFDDGAIDLSYSGGVAGYDFDWSGPNGFFSFSEDISGLEPGLYTVSVTDSQGCAGVASFEVEEPSPISVSANVVGVLCNGDDSGTIDITVSGGNGGYTFTWTGPTGFSSAFEDLNGLFSGNYTLSLTDIEGCTFSGNYNVNESPAIAITLVDIVDANCNLNNGAIEVSASGGNPSYTYAWTNAGGITVANGPLAQDLPFGTYIVTVTDEDLCQVSDSYSISNVEAGLSAVISDVSCNGFSDGAIDVTVTGALTGAVDTLWTGPAGFTASTEDITGLIIGTYTLTLSDELGCVFIEDYSVEQPLLLTSSATTTDLSCNGEVDGAIDLSTGGGTGTITVSWSGPNGFTALTEDISGLEGGNYTATLTDENLCTISSDYEVLEPALITATAIIVPVLCNGEFTGAIDLSPLGGIGVRTYAWIGPDGFTAITQDISDLEAGNYLVTITDANGCDEDFSFDVPENDAIDISLVDQEDANCNLLNGSIEVSASGGDSNLSYLWTDAGGLTVSTNAIAENLGIGVYTVTVTDGNGCTSETDFEILNQEVSLTGEAFDASCFGEANGSVSITVSGLLVGGVDTLWMGPGGYSSIMGDISGLLAGTYTVTITDAVGCILTDDFIVEEPALLVVTTAPTQNLCNGDLNGSIDTEISGGTLDYTYSWTGPDGFTSSLEDLINLAEGVYSLIVTDENDCIATSDIILTDPDTLAAAVSLTDPSCVGLDNGSIDLEMTGGTGTLVYNWMGPDGFISADEDLTDLAPGEYLVDVLDENGCPFAMTYTLDVQQVMAIDLVGTDISCNDLEDGTITLDVSGGNPGYGFAWNGPDAFSSASEDLSDLAAGDYALTITDDLGCSLDTLISLSEPTALEVLDLLSTDLDCFQDGSGSISLSTTGGTPGYTWEWNGPSGFLSTQEDLIGLVAGTYDLTLSDDNNCPLALSVTLMEPAELTVQAQSIQEAFCQNSPDGSIDVGINGGTPDFAVSWNGPDGFTSNDQNLQDILPGEYTITITDENDCITSAPFTVGFILDIMADAGTYPPICNGEAIDLDGSGSSEGVDYSWSLVNGTPFSNQVSTTFQATTESDLIVLTVSNGACIDRDTLILDILLLPMPDAGEDITSFVNEAVVLGGDPTWGDASSFSWFPPQNLDNPSSPNPIYINQGTTTFIVTVIDNNGCIATDEIIVTLDPTIEVPDGFTPNGDAYNNGWELANVGLFPGMVVQVFNRWGDELFQSPPGYPEPWDGEYDGSPLPVGTYYYVIELNDPLFPDPITGPLTIFR
ncbi:MAG: gliding motility-associated C-terminal domain-containing protein, partial [Bacteroidetes bacterium]|nr:gliding motility-associated C-terminal domain-containing protein [Bacteroidota bacterium]